MLVPSTDGVRIAVHDLGGTGSALLVSHATGLPLVIDEEPTMPEGQVYIRFGTAETKVDLAQVTTDIAIAVRAFFNLKS